MLRFGVFNKNIINDKDTVIITDESISKIFDIKGENVFLLPQGEKAKTFSQVEAICAFMLRCNITKKGTLVAVGGGSVGDTAGFAAAVYKRGIKYVNYPTTLLAMIDSAIGGKTAVDINGVKNAAGVFYPAHIVIDLNFLKTLPLQAQIDAWGEIVKYTFLSKDIFDAAVDVRKEGKWYDKKLIELCANYKYNLTKSVSHESKKRRALNMGHTLGHAIESLWQIPHGEAVLRGLYFEMLLAHKIFGDKHYLDNAERVKSLCPFEDRPLPDAKLLLPLLINDKKNTSEKIRFVFPECAFATREVLLSKEKISELLPL